MCSAVYRVLMADSARKTKTKYLTFENRNFKDQDEQYRPVNIYITKTETIEKRNMLRECLRRCFCCVCCESSKDQIENVNSSLVGPIGHSYTLNTDTSSTVTHLPTLTITSFDEDKYSELPDTKEIDDELSKSTTKLLLSSEKTASTINLSAPKYKVKQIVSNHNGKAEDSANNSRTSTLRIGEKNSFIRDVLSCRDSFLKSLEWCDNSLTRSKRCRHIKRDEWVELQNDGIKRYVVRSTLCFHFPNTYCD